MIRTIALFLLLLPPWSIAQIPEVPHKMMVAGIALTIRDDARREIQQEVDALMRSPKYFDMKVQRARIYFPVIEQILREERVPDDFKYLVLQESALIPDAVSVSNAVGYWQFKDFTALEMGLRVDDHVDERMNIVSSTRAAAQYLKKNNMYFNNWLYALQAYQMGAGAVMRSVKDYESGARQMEITSNTYWYVKKFLAHKIAFEPAVAGEADVRLIMRDVKGKKTVAELAHETGLSEEELLAYNRWIRKHTIPDDRTYTLAVPVTRPQAGQVASTTPADVARIRGVPSEESVSRRNGLPVIRAAEGDTWASLAAKAGLSLRALLRYNDCSIADRVEPGMYYYIRPKKNRAMALPPHSVRPGENLWNISQQYGITLKKLRQLNTQIPHEPAPGTLVHLDRHDKRSGRAAPVVQLDNEVFVWTVENSMPTVIAPVAVDVTPSREEEITLTMPAVNQHDGLQHVVRAGETFYSIARRYNVRVVDLLERNNLSVSAPIHPGQVLFIPETGGESVSSGEQPMTTAPASASAGLQYYEVKPSDTLYSIARRHGVTIRELMEWNGKKDFSVTPGEKLKIAKP